MKPYNAANWFEEIYNSFLKARDTYQGYLNKTHPKYRPKELKFSFSLDHDFLYQGKYNFTFSDIEVLGTAPGCIKDREKERLMVLRFYGNIPRVSIPISFYSPDPSQFVKDSVDALLAWFSSLPQFIFSTVHNKQTYLEPGDFGRYDLLYFVDPTLTRNVVFREGVIKVPLFPYDLHVFRRRELTEVDLEKLSQPW